MLGVAGILCVSVCISAIAKESVSPGALYNLVPRGLGSGAGLLTGGILLLLGVLIGPWLLLGLGMQVASFLHSVGTDLSPTGLYILEYGFLFALCAFALGKITVSTMALLVIELTGMAIIVVLLAIVAAKHGMSGNADQVTLSGATAHGTLLGVTFIVLSFGSYESAASLSVEAKNPRRAVPAALYFSVLAVGIYLAYNAWAQVLGFSGSSASLTETAAPLSFLADGAGISWLGDIVLLFVAISFIGSIIGWLNYSPRIMLTMSRDGLLPKYLQRTTPNTRSPIGGISAVGAVWFAGLTLIWITGTDITSAFANIGALLGYLFTLQYLLIAIAAPAFLWRRHELTAKVLGASCGALAVMLLTFYYSFRPFPAPPLRTYAIIFFAFVAAMFAIWSILRVVAPSRLALIGTTPADAAEVPDAGVSQG